MSKKEHRRHSRDLSSELGGNSQEFPLVKFYGERNCGTQYLRLLFRQNLPLHFSSGNAPRWVADWGGRLLMKELARDLFSWWTYAENLGWKHGTAPDRALLEKALAERQRLSVITISKNPYSWLLSLHKRPYHYQDSKTKAFGQFIRDPWKTVWRDRAGKRVLANPVELWNVTNASYLPLRGLPRVMVTTYEALLDDPATQIAHFAGLVGLPFEKRNFHPYETATKHRDASVQKKNTDYRDYYLNERWREKLCAEDIAFINEHLDRSVVEALGYRIIEPT